MIRALLMSLLLISGVIIQTSAQESEVIIIGNVHSPMPNYNSDTLFKILEKLNPDVILLEIDSAHFTTDNKFKYSSTENEQTATTKYIKKHSSVKIGPFEFEGRNEYRLQNGIKQSDQPAMQLLDSLFTSKLLTNEQAAIVTAYHRLTDTLNAFGYKGAYYFNNKNTDSISKIRQYYQHYKLREVINQREEFTYRFVTTTTGEKITLQEGYNRQCDFWDLRNQTMARNIIKVIDKNPNKRIIVLTGYFHRYYLLEEIAKIKYNRNFSIKEFYN